VAPDIVEVVRDEARRVGTEHSGTADVAGDLARKPPRSDATKGEMSPPDSPTPAAETFVGGIPKSGARFRSDGARPVVRVYH